MTNEKPINDDQSINPYEAPHYVEGESEPIRQLNRVEIVLFGVNATFSSIFILAFLFLIIRPETPDQRLGGIICIIPLVICTTLEFAAILSLRTWVRRILGIADIVFGALFAIILLIDSTTSDSSVKPSIAPDRNALTMAMLVGFYFILCGAYRLDRIREADVVPLANRVEERDSQSTPEGG